MILKTTGLEGLLAVTTMSFWDFSLVLLTQAVGVPVGQRLGGRLATTLVATKKRLYFLFFLLFFIPFFFSVITFSHRRSARIKTYLAKVDGSAQNPWVRPLSRFHRPFWGSLEAILDFGRLAGGEQVLPVLRKWKKKLYASINNEFNNIQTL